MGHEKIFRAEQIVQRSLKEVFTFFSQAENLQKITPPSLNFKILTPIPLDMHAGTLIDYKISMHGIPMKWRTLIEAWEPPYRFIDTQLNGPYKLWHHTHEFKELGPDETLILDTVCYEVPFGIFGLIAEAAFVRKEIEKIFAFRRAAVERVFS